MQSTKQNLYAKKQESIFNLTEDLKNKLERKKGSLENVEHDLKQSVDSLFTLEEQSKIILKAQNLLNKISNDLRSSSLTAVEGIVSSAIREVFTDKETNFRMEMNPDTAKPALRTFVQEGEKQFSILDSRGLGMADLISVALRICIHSMYKPKITFPIILDEPFKFLHGESVEGSYPTNAFEFLKKITSGLETQVILVTGAESKDFVKVADKIFHIEQENGVSTIKENE